jgi:guanylate kinase
LPLDDCSGKNELETMSTLLIVTGPFGAGKTEITKALQEQYGYKKPITVTTRKPRLGETNGIDYHFKTTKEFEELIRTGAFLEYALVNERYYGTLKSSLVEPLERDEPLALNVDPQGVISLKGCSEPIIQERLVSIYLEVGFGQAVKRARARPGGMSFAELRMRCRTRSHEEKLKHHCQFRVKNPDGGFDKALREILNICQRRQISFAK